MSCGVYGWGGTCWELLEADGCWETCWELGAGVCWDVVSVDDGVDESLAAASFF